MVNQRRRSMTLETEYLEYLSVSGQKAVIHFIMSQIVESRNSPPFYVNRILKLSITFVIFEQILAYFGPLTAFFFDSIIYKMTLKLSKEQRAFL